MTNTSTSVSTWTPVVERIAAGSQSAVGELYLHLRSIRFFFVRQVGRDHSDDAYHNLILDLVSAIQKGALRAPESLPAYAMTIARGKVCTHIRKAIRERREHNVVDIVLASPTSDSPEQIALRTEREAIAKRVLTALPPRQREVLIRFYLDGESEEEIRAATGMSHNQFRLIKSRAKLRYTELVQEAMNKGRKRQPADATVPDSVAQPER